MEKKQPLILRVRPGYTDSKDAIGRAADTLRKGSLVIMPTDTVYGVAADARIAGWDDKLYRAKSRDRGKPIPVLAANIDQVENYGVVLDCVERVLAERFWPGPLTLVLRAGSVSEAFRVPACAIALELLRMVGGVLRVTSANVSGESPALTVEDAIASIGEHVDVALDAGVSPGGVASTVAKVEKGSVVVLRQGAISREELVRLTETGA